MRAYRFVNQIDAGANRTWIGLAGLSIDFGVGVSRSTVVTHQQIYEVRLHLIRLTDGVVMSHEDVTLNSGHGGYNTNCTRNFQWVSPRRGTALILIEGGDGQGLSVGAGTSWLIPAVLDESVPDSEVLNVGTPTQVSEADDLVFGTRGYVADLTLFEGSECPIMCATMFTWSAAWQETYLYPPDEFLEGIAYYVTRLDIAEDLSLTIADSRMTEFPGALIDGFSPKITADAKTGWILRQDGPAPIG